MPCGGVSANTSTIPHSTEGGGKKVENCTGDTPDTPDPSSGPLHGPLPGRRSPQAGRSASLKPSLRSGFACVTCYYSEFFPTRKSTHYQSLSRKFCFHPLKFSQAKISLFFDISKYSLPRPLSAVFLIPGKEEDYF